jgi:hypothetical protein
MVSRRSSEIGDIETRKMPKRKPGLVRSMMELPRFGGQI